MKKYEVNINGVSHVLLLDDEDVSRHPDAKPHKVKKSGTEPSAKAPTDVEPAGNASLEDWSTFAVEVKGAKPEDLVDADGKALGRDELKAKFGARAGGE